MHQTNTEKIEIANYYQTLRHCCSNRKCVSEKQIDKTQIIFATALQQMHFWQESTVLLYKQKKTLLCTIFFPVNWLVNSVYSHKVFATMIEKERQGEEEVINAEKKVLNPMKLTNVVSSNVPEVDD